MTKRLNLVAAGFVRRPDLDFSDDGTRFFGYDYRGLPVTYCKADGRYYLYVREDYLRYDGKCNYTWEDWSKTEEYRLCDEFNGAEDVDVEKLKENCIRIMAKMEELSNSVLEEEINEDVLIDALGKEAEYASMVISEFKHNFKWYEVDSKYELSRLIDYMKSAERDVMKAIAIRTSIKKHEIDCRRLREYAQQLEKYGYVEIEEDDFYLKEMKEALAKY